ANLYLPGSVTQTSTVRLFARLVLQSLVFREQGDPAGDLGAEMFCHVVEISGGVFYRVVQDRGGEHGGIVDAKDVASNEANSENMAVIGRDAVFAKLAMMGAGSEGDGIEQAVKGWIGDVHGESRSICIRIRIGRYYFYQFRQGML